MLRLSTPGFQRFVQAQHFDATYGGGEANVAVSLANYRLESYFVSRLPRHEIGQAAVNHLRRFGVDTRFVVRGGERVGIYFLETGASQRPPKVVYDRAGAAVADLTADDLDFDALFGGERDEADDPGGFQPRLARRGGRAGGRRRLLSRSGCALGISGHGWRAVCS